KIKAAVLAFGGWADNYMNAVPELVSKLAGPVKGIIGPWVHQYPHMAAPSPQIDFLNELIRWWDHWLKGTDNGVENDPALIYYLQDSVRPKRSYSARPGTWLAELDMPNNRVKVEKFYLNGLNKVSSKKPLDFKVSLFSPTFCGLTQGEFFPMSLAFSEGEGPPELPGDQRADDAYSACFDTEVFDVSTSIVGRAVLTLKLVSSVAQTQIAVRLCDVHPDGASTKICHGLLNLSHRNGDENPEVLEPGSPAEVRVALDEAAYNLPTGHKLRIAVSNSYWPFVWPAAVQSTINILSGSIEIPIHQSVSLTDEYSFNPPKELEGWAHVVLREGSYNKVIKNDLGQNSITLEINSDSGRVKDSSHHLVTDQVAKEVWSINPIDPLSAKGLIEWTQEISRNEWVTAIDTSCSMTADENYFYIKGNIAAKEKDEIIFSKEFNHTIVRNFK
ncbi:MAG: putative acyl esterase, partial [Paracoccaceae bacterium]